MRKRILWAVAAMVGLVLADAAQPGARPRPGPEDVLFLRTSGSITLVRTKPEAVAVNLPDAVPSTDWSAVVRAIPQDGQTRIVALDSVSGEELWSRDVAGDLEVKVASRNGRLITLGSLGEDTGYPAGRSSTTLVLVSRDAPKPRTIELRGNYEPEAFSTDGKSLFVIQYLPPRDPTRYRVRRLELQTEQVVGVYTIDAELQEAMRGTARVQAASPDGRRLYTLYTLEGPEGTRRAFVHVLSLNELWAHCVDLPATFGTGREKAIAISVAPDGKRLYVADASTGTVAEIDTEALAVTRTIRAAFASPGGAAQAATGSNGMLYLGKGQRLLALDASTLAPGRSWRIFGKIMGIQVASDDTRLYVGLKNEILILDPATGKRLGALDPANLGAIEQLGQSTRSLDDDRTEIVCAC